jgi:hypothetical protein
MSFVENRIYKHGNQYTQEFIKEKMPFNFLKLEGISVKDLNLMV